MALTERDSSYGGYLPDTITIYRDALLEMCDTAEEVVEEGGDHGGARTGSYHFGIDDDRLHNWVGPEAHPSVRRNPGLSVRGARNES